MDALSSVFFECIEDEKFVAEFKKACQDFSGRTTPLTYLENLSKHIGGAKIYLKREDLNQTGAHKINHCIGQIMLAKRLGKTRIIAETGAGQHGYATASVCARFGMQCTIYMGQKDYDRQRPNVFWMETLGATVVPVQLGNQTLNDAVIAAFKDLIAHPEETHYLLGSAVGPHPYPVLNTWFQKIVGEEAREQILAAESKLPDYVTACVGGGSNALGVFFDFLEDEAVKLIGVEAGGRSKKMGDHAAKVNYGKEGIFEGYHSYFLQADEGNIADTHSISAGLDYCGVSPILAYLHNKNRVEFTAATDVKTLDAMQMIAKYEGIILALESSHSLAWAIEKAKELSPTDIILVNGSGRGEKDLFITMRALQPDSLRFFMEQQIKEIA
ncbi:UNVERIFIED_CONTAM: hypothetical protein GTU68_043701 [Idotea baltica]|nr:hypothetical protein [Idotea baltica]